MDKTAGRVQILDGRIFFSPNCSRTVHHPPPVRDEQGSEPNMFLPSHQPNHRRNFFELNIASYSIPRWWTLAFGWISFFPLHPSLSGPIFEKLVIPGNHHHVFNEEHGEYSMASGLSDKWLRVDNDLSDAVHLIRSHYHLTFIYPFNPSGFGYSKAHKRSGALHMALRKGRDWFVVWMALLSFVIAQAEAIYPTVEDSVILAKMAWYDILLQHFDPQWLEALLASTVCSFSPYTPRAGVFLDLSVNDSTQPPPEFFYRFHVPVWYCWSADMASQPKFAHLGPLTCQLQEGTTTISKYPCLPTPLPPSSVGQLLPSTVASSQPKKSSWVDFLARCHKHYEEWVKQETPQQQQIRLERLHNPPKVSAKVFEWLVNDHGDLIREAVPKKMREDVLGSYPAYQIHYNPIENEYDCCDKYDSGIPGESFDDDDSNGSLAWTDDDVGGCARKLNDDQVLSPRALSPDIEIDDSWSAPSLINAPDPAFSNDNFIAEVLRILHLHFGYTPLIPTPKFPDPVLKLERDIHRFKRFLGILCSTKFLPLSAFKTDPISAAAIFVNQLYTKESSISADEWDLSRENRQSIFFSARLKALRCVRKNSELFMFDFKEHSTVKWKLTVTTPAHALLICRLDSQLDESGLAHYLLQNGIPFHTLQLSTTLSQSPLSTHPPLVIPFRNADYVFTWRDYEAFRQQCHVIFKQARGRAALLRGYYPWRLAINDVGFSSVISGPSGLSTNAEEILVVKLPETGEEFIDDKLTDIELKLLSGLYNTLTGMYL
jgi:hypothetical protein